MAPTHLTRRNDLLSAQPHLPKPADALAGRSHDRLEAHLDGADASWLDEIDLDPTHSSLAMATRALGDRPWLVDDRHRDDQHERKARLCAERHGDVFTALPDTERGGEAVEALVDAALVGSGLVGGSWSLLTNDDSGRPPDPPSRPLHSPLDRTDSLLHPLDRAGRSVQEDLCLLRRRSDGWYLEAASLCSPSRWRLADKIDRHITDVHGPVDGYAEHLAPRVDRLLDRLTDHPVWRRNWFIHPDAALFQPVPPPGGDPVIPAAEALATLVVRSERQTLHRLSGVADDSAWILFTIRVQQVGVDQFVANDSRRGALHRWLTEAPPEVIDQRGVSAAQAAELAAALGT